MVKIALDKLQTGSLQGDNQYIDFSEDKLGAITAAFRGNVLALLKTFVIESDAKQSVFNPVAVPTLTFSGSTSLTQTIGTILDGALAQGGSLTSITLQSGAPSTGIVGNRINIASGTGYGQTGIITAYDGSSKMATVNWTSTIGAPVVAPDATSWYGVLNTLASGFSGQNLGQIGSRGPGGSQPTIMHSPLNCSNYNPGMVETNFYYNGSSIDLIAYGSGTPKDIWIDDQYVGAYIPVVKTGTCQAGSTSSTIVFDSGASTQDGYYNDCTARLTNGASSGQKLRILSYVGSTRTATVAGTWGNTPTNSTTFSIDASDSGIALTPLDGSVNYIHVPFTKKGTYKITILSQDFSGIVMGVNDSIRPAPPGKGGIPLMVVGDSFWNGTGRPRNTPSVFWLLSKMLGSSFLDCTAGGTGWVTAGNSLNFVDRICPPGSSWNLLNTATGGTYTISVTYGGTTQTTTALAYNASLSTITAAIQALSNVPASSPLIPSGSVQVCNGEIFGRPLRVILHGPDSDGGCLGATLSVDSTNLSGGRIIVSPWLGDVARNVPYDSNGNALPFILYVPASQNDNNLTATQVGYNATFVAQRIAALFPTAIVVYRGLDGYAPPSGGNAFTSGDLAYETALQAAAAYLPLFPGGVVPYIKTMFAGVGGKPRIYGSGTVAAPTSNTTDYMRSTLDGSHQTGDGHFNEAVASLYGFKVLFGLCSWQ